MSLRDLQAAGPGRLDLFEPTRKRSDEISPRGRNDKSPLQARSLPLPLPLPTILFLFLVLFLIGSVPQNSGAELLQPLREASELYRLNHLSESRKLALSLHRSFPDHLETLLLLVRIDIAREDIRSAKGWLRSAARLQPRHPLVMSFVRVIEEYEYRRGSLDVSNLPELRPDPSQTAESFQRGWFGPQGTHLSPTTPTAPPPSAPAQPHSGSRLVHSFARQATDALQRGLYLKAYLFFAQLIRDDPRNAQYRLGKAMAAYSMGRFNESEKLLATLARNPDFSSLTPDQQDRVRRLWTGVRQKLSLPNP